MLYNWDEFGPSTEFSQKEVRYGDSNVTLLWGPAINSRNAKNNKASYSGNNMTGTKNTGCQKKEFMRKKRVIIRPPERKFSKQMEISKEREESKREGESCQGD